MTSRLLRILCLGALLAASLLRANAQIPPDEHRLGPKDQISVEVYQEPDLSALVMLDQDGSINLPLVGPVSIGGLTIAEASQAITAKYKDGYLVNPNVRTLIKAYAKRRFTVLGAVNKAGSFYFPDGETVSLQQAIGMAGGYTRIASPSKIRIKRGSLAEPLKVDGKKLAKSGEAATFMIQPGDIIEVGESLF